MTRRAVLLTTLVLLLHSSVSEAAKPEVSTDTKMLVRDGDCLADEILAWQCPCSFAEL